ncbi:MAG: hypothetical protein AAF862_15115 [Pseudomonadota bacterium]
MLALVAGFAVIGCDGAAEFPVLDCTSLDIRVAGRSLVGIEDIAQYDGRQLILSAQNRKDVSVSPKGLFLFDTAQRGAVVTATRVTPEADPLVPHGIALEVETSSIYAVDHSEAQARIIRYDMTGGSKRIALSPEIWTDDAPYPCNLNDIAAAPGGRILATNDRQSCSWFGRLLDNVFGRENGAIIELNVDGTASILADGLFFPNGIAVDGGDVWVAQTRAKQITHVQSGAALVFAGGPDNISPSAYAQRHWVAVIPSLFRFSLMIAGLSDYSPSLVSAFDEDINTYAVTEFSGATTVVEMAEHLYIGGAFAQGLAKCKRPDA